MFHRIIYFFSVWKRLTFCSNMDKVFKSLAKKIILKDSDFYIEYLGDSVYKFRIFEPIMASKPKITAYIDFSTLETKIKEENDYYKYQWFGYRPSIKTLKKTI